MMGAFAVFLGGGLGAVLRYAIATCFPFKTFPWATLISNICACFIFAIAVLALKTNPQHKILYLFLITGVCGGFSTFSTFSYETFELFRAGNVAYAVLNIASSLLCCILVFYAMLRTYS